MEQEKCATDFVDMIRALGGYKCAPCHSPHANAARTEMRGHNSINRRSSVSAAGGRYDDAGGGSDAADGDDDSVVVVRAVFTRDEASGRTRSTALNEFPRHHITPTERAMIWDALRHVYQFAEPLHSKRWLSAISRLHEDASFCQYHSVTTVSHILFAAVRHLRECMLPRVHEKLKRWANRCLYLIQRRSLTLMKIGRNGSSSSGGSGANNSCSKAMMLQPTYKAINVSCAGLSRDIPMETTSLPSVLAVIAELHEEKAKKQRKETRKAERAEQKKVLFVARREAAIQLRKLRGEDVDGIDVDRLLAEEEEAAVSGRDDEDSNSDLSELVSSEEDEESDEDEEKDEDEDGVEKKHAADNDQHVANDGGAITFFDYNERRKLQQEQRAIRSQLDPRKRRKERRAKKRALLFAELKKNAMEERVTSELKAEILQHRNEILKTSEVANKKK